MEFFRQSHDYTCAVAALRTVLANQCGVRVSEAVLEAFGTEAAWPIRERGASALQIRRMLSECNRAYNTGPPWRMHFRSKGRVADLARHLRAGRLPMARVQQPDGDLHMVVVLRVTAKRVQLFDPSFATPRWMSRTRFQDWWCDFGGLTWYAVVS